MRKTFDEKNAPAVIFIDEIDLIYQSSKNPMERSRRLVFHRSVFSKKYSLIFYENHQKSRYQ